MSQKGNDLDNAVAENFFGLLRSELLYMKQFQSLKHLKQEQTRPVNCLEYCNTRRVRIK